MKILLVNPPNCGRSIPEERYGITSLRQIFRGEPLALETIAGGLEGHDVQILDLKASSKDFGETTERFRPDIVGLTAVTCEANTVARLAGEIKEACGAITAIGGIHASSDPLFFNQSGIDYVVVGLGKASFAELVRGIESHGVANNIPGVGRTNPKGTLAFTPRCFGPADLMETHPPRYDLVDCYRDKYTLSSLGFRLGLVASAYGCPYRCNFCCIEAQAGGSYLTHSVEAVVDDIRHLSDIPVIRLVDANTFGNVSHARELADAIIAAGVKKNFVADVRADTVVRHPELIRRWKEAGLRSVVVGFEDVTDAGLLAMDKSSDVGVNDEAIAILHDLGVSIVGDFIIPPNIDDKGFDDLERYVVDRKIDLPIVTVMTPLPGTRFHSTVADKILIHDLDYYTLTNAVLPTQLPEIRFYERYAAMIKSFHAHAKL